MPIRTPSEFCDLTVDGSCHWYAAYTKPCHEKLVAKHLEIRSVEWFLPLYHSSRRWNNGCTVNLESPLFPSYVFVHIRPGERLRVLKVPSVLYIAGIGRQPTSLPDEDIERLRSKLYLVNAEPHPVLTVGEKVRIVSGPLEGMSGIVSRKKNRFLVVLTLDLIQKSLAVEVCEQDVEPMGEPETRSYAMAACAHL